MSDLYSTVRYSDYRWIPPVHVWVDVTLAWDEPQPGVLVGWRRSSGVRTGWEGLVVSASSAALAHGGSPTIRVEWYDAEHIRRAAVEDD